MSGPILVVGTSGQLGTELMQRGDPRHVVGVDLPEFDCRDANGVRTAFARFQPALVINAAAYTAVDKAEAETALAFAVNCDGPANLAAACAEARIPLLHVSTDYVFDGGKSGAYRETDPVGPLGVYGASKLAGEELVRERLDTHVIVRTAWLFSAHGANFVKTILRLAAERPELRVIADQNGGPTPAADLADALLAIAAKVQLSGAGWGTYHYCGVPHTNWCAFARAIVVGAAQRGRRAVPVTPIATADYPLPAKRPVNSVLDCTRIRDVFGIAQPDWRSGLDAVLATLLQDGARS